MVIVHELDVIAVENNFSVAGMSVVAIERTKWASRLPCCSYFRAEKTYPLRNYHYHAGSGMFIMVTVTDKAEAEIWQFVVHNAEMRKNLCDQLPESVLVL